MTLTYSALIVATVSVAPIHSLAPDHWLPFVMIGKAQSWSKKRLALITFISGIGHVGSSIVLGGLGLLLGIASIKLGGVETTRGHIGVYLLIAFGIVYGIWGLRHAKHHHHSSFDLSHRHAVTFWTLFAVFVLGPCEPLIPLMFLGTSYGTTGIVTISAVFAAVTLVMMIAQSLLGYAGIELIKHRIAEQYSHAVAGGVIALTGIFLLLI